MQIKTFGFILKQRDIGENDRIVTILTADLGIIEATAPRVKTARSGISSACQLLCYSQLCLFHSKKSYIINSAEIVNSFYSLRLDLVKVALAGYFCELCTYLSPGNENAGNPSRNLSTTENANDFLKLLLNSLHLLQEDKKPQMLIKSVFELRALCLTGFMPDLVACSVCGVFENELMFFLPLDGKLVCENCLLQSEYRNEKVLKFQVNMPILSALRHITYSSCDKIFSFKLHGDSLSQLDFITENYALFHTEGKFPSLKIYKELNADIPRNTETE